MRDGTPVHLVFMLEEESAKKFLEGLLPKVLSPYRATFQCIPHQGKSHLQKSIPRKLRAWHKPNDFFVILHDLDSHPDCKVLKNELRQICASAGDRRPLIRIACQELEAWYFGDLDAVEKAFPEFKADQYRNKPKFKNPDAIPKPSEVLKKAIKGFSKERAARTVPRYMNINGNVSTSFNQTVVGINHFVKKCSSAAQQN